MLPKKPEPSRYDATRTKPFAQSGAIPAMERSGVLPPFIGTPIEAERCSPYRTTLTSIATRFSNSPARKGLLRGFVEYRRALRSIGIVRGFQWIDGSFVENKKDPSDVDVCTFFFRPESHTDDRSFQKLLNEHEYIFHPYDVKARFRCDVQMYIDMSAVTTNPQLSVSLATFWHGLFSHRKRDGRRKGFLQVSIEDGNNDEDVVVALDNGAAR
jgi:hypothetical protein